MTIPVGAAQPDLTSGLRIYMLGAPRVEWNGQHVAITRRQARAMLFYVAAHKQQVPRDNLIFQFWPDLPEAAGRRHCSRVIASLRAALPCPDIFLSETERLRLNPELVWCDLATFHRLAAAPYSPQRHEMLQAATELYRGPFLDGFSVADCPEFNEWVAQERSTLERTYLDLLIDLMEIYTVRQDIREAIAAARSYLQVDNLAEQVHRNLIHYYAALGDRTAAVRAYEECREVLQRELGVEPQPETQATYQAVLHSQHLAAARVHGGSWATLPGLRLPLAGREKEMQALSGSFARASARRGAAVLITGEPGSGKSRLMQEFASTTQGVVLKGAGHPATQGIAFAPVVEALRSLPSEAWLMPNVMQVWLADIVPLMPELRIVYPNLAAPAPAPAAMPLDNGRVFEALAQLTFALTSGPHPGLLCLDDLQWADRASLDWLVYCARNLGVRRFLIVGTCRSDELASIDDLRHNLRRLGLLNELKLEGLDTTAVLELMRCLSGPMPSDLRLAERLQLWTAGNPFFLTETLQTLLDSGELLAEPDDAAALPISAAVQDAIQARLVGVSPACRGLLEAATMLPEPFDLDQVAAVSRRTLDETLVALEGLIARSLLVENQAGLSFRHPILRQAVHERMSRARQRLLSRDATHRNIHPSALSPSTAPHRQSILSSLDRDSDLRR